jgi:hypothetical protein|tara:strand:+ start:48 stop:278 length:231 start_codon:yes stop_codon:yes gene_type:complete
MATRVGKYKISKKESELSLRDGGEVSGKLTVTGDVSFTGLGTTGAGVSSNLLFTTASSGAGGVTGSLKGVKVVCLA